MYEYVIMFLFVCEKGSVRPICGAKTTKGYNIESTDHVERAISGTQFFVPTVRTAIRM
jgi:hypothetical protein